MSFELIVIPVLVGFFTQALKLVIDGIPNNFRWQHLVSDYGGMPSSHTAFVASTATVVGLAAGFDSAAFAVAFILLTIVIRDAIGFRREIGRNAVLTNLIGRQVFDKKVGRGLSGRALSDRTLADGRGADSRASRGAKPTSGLSAGRALSDGREIEYLNERVGHTLVEVLAGLLLGGGLSVFLFLMFLLM